jgi:hypothetical protein
MSAESSGLYHPYFTEQERRDLELVPHDDLTGEINLQRHLLGLVMSKSPPDLDFNLLLEKNRACNTAIRSLVSLIYAETEIRRNRTPWWEQLIEEACELACEQLGFSNYLSPERPVSQSGADDARSDDPVLRRQVEMEATFDSAEEPPLPAESPPLPLGRVPESEEGQGSGE